MSKHLLRAFATQEPERFAELLGMSQDVSSTLRILTEIPDGMECDVVARLPTEAAGRLLSGLADPVLVSWLEFASLDAGRRMLSRINSDRSARLIRGISNRSKRRALRSLSGYPAGSIGALVQTQMAKIREDTPASAIAENIKRQGASLEGPILVEHHDGTLRGVLDLTRFVQNLDNAATADDFCITPKPVYPDSPSSTLENPDAWTGLTSLPVVDHENRPIGYITRSALEKSAGKAGGDDHPLGSMVELSKRYWEVSAALMALIFGGRAER
jgi:Mg/Co/Ni transporter MgtE